MRNIQLSYYMKNRVNPVFIETKGQKWEKHLHVRNNLYENHLRIPVSWFDRRSILEFGPNGGENALVLAMHGAQISLVEPHEIMHKRIRTLYNEANLEDNLFNIDMRTLEQYKDNELYDLVIAEGFIHALPDRLEVIRKLCSLSSNFVIFTYNEKFGYFFESLKRCLFRRLIELNQLDDNDWDQMLDLAERTYLNSFKKLESARTFDSWVKDILLNPCGTSKSCDSFDQIASVFKQANFDYYSGSPVWDLRSTHKWYKNILNEDLIEEYYNNISFFITGNKNEEISVDSIKLISMMTETFLDYSSNIKEFSDIDKLPTLNISDWQYANEVNQLLILLSKDDSRKIIDYYKQSSLCNMWGMPHHYVCLKKKFN